MRLITYRRIRQAFPGKPGEEVGEYFKRLSLWLEENFWIFKYTGGKNGN